MKHILSLAVGVLFISAAFAGGPGGPQSGGRRTLNVEVKGKCLSCTTDGTTITVSCSADQSLTCVRTVGDDAEVVGCNCTRVEGQQFTGFQFEEITQQQGEHGTIVTFYGCRIP